MIYNKNTSQKTIRFGKFEAIRYVIGTESVHIVSTDYRVIYRNILSRQKIVEKRLDKCLTIQYIKTRLN